MPWVQSNKSDQSQMESSPVSVQESGFDNSCYTDPGLRDLTSVCVEMVSTHSRVHVRKVCACSPVCCYCSYRNIVNIT